MRGYLIIKKKKKKLSSKLKCKLHFNMVSLVRTFLAQGYFRSYCVGSLIFLLASKRCYLYTNRGYTKTSLCRRRLRPDTESLLVAGSNATSRTFCTSVHNRTYRELMQFSQQIPQSTLRIPRATPRKVLKLGWNRCRRSSKCLPFCTILESRDKRWTLCNPIT